MKILLLAPISLTDWPLYCPPISLCIMKALLKRNGFDNVKVVDMTRQSMSEYTTLLKQEKPDILGITCFTETRVSVFHMFEVAKQLLPSIITVAGGVHPTIMYEQVLKYKPMVDYIVRGEGEITFLELVRALAEKSDLEEVAGIAFRKGNHLMVTKERPLIKDLDSLPGPDYSDIDLYAYKGEYWFERGKPRASILSSRGCPYSCIFCSSKEVFSRWRARSAESVVDEFEWYAKDLGFRYFSIIDDLAILNKERFQRICQGILDRRLAIKWFTQTRADCIDEDTVRLMRESGCQILQFGVESGSPIILKALDKRETVEQFEYAFEICRKVGLRTQMMLIVGSPGETEETIEETKLLIRKTRPYIVQVSNILIFPGTKLMTLGKEQGVFSEDQWLTEEPYFWYTGAMSAQKMNKYHKDLLLEVARVHGLRGYIQLLSYFRNKLLADPRRTLKILLGREL